jgi:hypothetical protein
MTKYHRGEIALQIGAAETTTHRANASRIDVVAIFAPRPQKRLTIVNSRRDCGREKCASGSWPMISSYLVLSPQSEPIPIRQRGATPQNRAGETWGNYFRSKSRTDPFDVCL